MPVQPEQGDVVLLAADVLVVDDGVGHAEPALGEAVGQEAVRHAQLHPEARQPRGGGHGK